MPFSFDKIGRWWDNNNEIDFVALDSAGSDIVFGECKYTSGKMDVSEYYELIEKTRAVSWNCELRSEFFVFFSINGYSDRMKDLAAEMGNIFLFD